MKVTPIDLDITERLRDHDFAVEYVKALEEEMRHLKRLVDWRDAHIARALEIIDSNLFHKDDKLNAVKSLLQSK